MLSAQTNRWDHTRRDTTIDSSNSIDTIPCSKQVSAFLIVRTISNADDSGHLALTSIYRRQDAIPVDVSDEGVSVKALDRGH